MTLIVGAATKQFKDAHQELTEKGFGLYGLTRDEPAEVRRNSEKRGISTKWLHDESRDLVTALGFDKGTGGELTKGIVVIAKDGRVLASKAGHPSASLETVKPLLETLDTLERTPTQEYTGEGYFVRSPISPPPSLETDYFGESAAISPSTAALHSYLQQMDRCSPPSPRRLSAVDSSATPSRRPSVVGRRAAAIRTQTWHPQIIRGSSERADTDCTNCNGPISQDGHCMCDGEIGHGSLQQANAGH